MGMRIVERMEDSYLLMRVSKDERKFGSTLLKMALRARYKLKRGEKAEN